MKAWKTLQGSNTFQDLIDTFNNNATSSEFIDGMLGAVLSNGVLFNGTETIEGKSIQPLQPVDIQGVVQSDTILDNFELYFRNSNSIVKLDQFPIDLLSYADGKPHFLYIQENLDYRVSDYMFGKADEILIGRFVINTDLTWNHFYIMSQRAGTPMYSASDEFYTVDGMSVKSPTGLKLAQISGSVKRSGIDFTDKTSPDIYHFYNTATTDDAKSIRYVNALNEVDYSTQVTQNVITNKYLEYNLSTTLKNEAETLILRIENIMLSTNTIANSIATKLHEAILSEVDHNTLVNIINEYLEHINIIVEQTTTLYTKLNDPVLASVSKEKITTFQNDINTYISTYLQGSAVAGDITEVQVNAIRNSVSYVIKQNLTIYAEPLEVVLQIIQDDLDSITFPAGTIKDVPEGKFTVQRILWDIYEDCLVIQYGDRVYNTFSDAVKGSSLLDFPAPFGKTIYIPLSIMIIKSGATNISLDTECIIVDRRWIEVTLESSSFTDYIARATAEKALTQINELLSGDIAIGKANTLKYTTNTGATAYESGDYFLNYNNFKNALSVVNNLNASSYNEKQVLSAYQGYILNTTKISKSGDTLTGTLNTMDLVPKTTSLYNLGSSTNSWNNVYADNMYKGTSTNSYIASNGNSVLDVRAIAKSSVTDSYWTNLPNKTMLICW